jgi:CheY-like chemotaxis protein
MMTNPCFIQKPDGSSGKILFSPIVSRPDVSTKEQAILIVEDESLIALHLQEILLNAGYSITGPVSSGEEAVDYVRTSLPPDLIVMDIALDGLIDGFEAVRRIHALKDIPVLFLSAHSDSDKLAMTGTATPYSFLEKPFIQTDVISAVDKALHH